MSLTIDPVRSQAELGEFIRLPREIYQGMPGFVPPLDGERRELIDPKRSPFFTHGRAAYWIARRDGNPVGRISAQIDNIEGPETPPDLGQFGCLDAIDDRKVTAALFDTAEGWLRGHGRNQFRGPFILSINGESGLLIDGQTQRPMTLLPWHPPYLESHVLAAGYRRATKLFSFAVDLTQLTQEKLQQLATKTRQDFPVQSMRLRDFKNEMEIARSIYNDGWQNNWGFVPGTAADVAGLARSFWPFLMQDAGFFLSENGKPVAFALSIPNIFDISSDLGGAPSLWGWCKLLWRMRRKRYRSFRLVFIGAKTSHHGTGIGKAALFETIRRLKRYDAEVLTCAWVLESNAALIQALQHFGFSAVATYGLYEK
jgi:hypothetical protein